jgi:RadC-like JAB domain
VDEPRNAVAIARHVISGEIAEVLTVLLDSRHRVTGFAEVARGTVSASRFNPCDVLVPALAANAAGVIYHKVLLSFVNFCRREGWDISDGVLGLRGPRTAQREPEIFTAEEERRLLEAAQCERDASSWSSCWRRVCASASWRGSPSTT